MDSTSSNAPPSATQLLAKLDAIEFEFPMCGETFRCDLDGLMRMFQVPHDEKAEKVTEALKMLAKEAVALEELGESEKAIAECKCKLDQGMIEREDEPMEPSVFTRPEEQIELTHPSHTSQMVSSVHTLGVLYGTEVSEIRSRCVQVMEKLDHALMELGAKRLPCSL